MYNLPVKTAINFLDKIPKIDYGGCGISALAIYKTIKRYYPKVDIKIVLCYPVYDDDGLLKDFEKDLSNLEQGNLAGIEFCDHIVIKYKNFYLDRTGIVLREYINCSEKVEINLQELETMLKTSKWCSSFDRKRFVPVIAENLNLRMDDYV